MSPKSQTITFKFTGRLCDVWERGPKTSQDSVMEQAIQDNLFPARLRCRLWIIEMRWNELLAPLIVLQLTHTSVRLNPIERLGSKVYWRAARDPSPWPIGSLAVRPCTRNQFEGLETSLFVPENIIVYLSFWGYPLILDYQYRNTFLFHSTVCLIRRTWQPAFDPAPEMNDFRLQQDRRWEMGLCHWLQWHGTE